MAPPLTAMVPLPDDRGPPSTTAMIPEQHRAGSEKSSLLRARFASGISGLHDAPVWMGFGTRARFDQPVGNCASRPGAVLVPTLGGPTAGTQVL